MIDIKMPKFNANTSNLIIEPLSFSFIDIDSNTKNYFKDYNIIPDRTNTP